MSGNLPYRPQRGSGGGLYRGGSSRGRGNSQGASQGNHSHAGGTNRGRGCGRPPAGQTSGLNQSNSQGSRPGIYRKSSVPTPNTSVTEIEDSLAKPSRKPGSASSGGFPTRPAYGRRGTEIDIRVNYFHLKMDKSDLTLHRYSVEIQALSEAGAPRQAVPRALKRRALQMLLRDNEFTGSVRATDGSGIIVTDRRLNLQQNEWSGQIVVPGPGHNAFPPADAADSDSTNAARKRNTVQFTIKFNGEFHLKDLMVHLRTRQSQTSFRDEESLIQMMNILICRYPHEQSSLVEVGANQFFPRPSHPSCEYRGLGKGLLAVRGSYASVRPATGRLLINLNVKSKAFYQHGPLRALVNAFLGRDLTDGQDNALPGLARFLSHLKVETGYLRPRDSNGRVDNTAPPKQAVHVIQGFASGPNNTASQMKFMYKEGQNGHERRVTVLEYFKNVHNIELKYKDEPVLTVGNPQNPSYMPMELCNVIAGQAVHHLLDPNQTKEMIRFAARHPLANAESIEGHAGGPGSVLSSFGLDGKNQPNTLSPLGLSLDTNMISIKARVLLAPALLYDARTEVKPHGGSWNLLNEETPLKFRSAKAFGKLSILAISYGNANTEPVPVLLLNMLRDYRVRPAEVLGVSNLLLEKPHKSNRARLDSQLSHALKKQSDEKIDILLVILADRDPWLYSRIKFYCDIVHGFHSICITKDKLSSPSPASIFANIALKFNVKAGGVNHNLSPRDLVISFSSNASHDERTMLMGIDVTHPSPGSAEKAPSIAAVVASSGQSLGHWPGSVRRQTGRQEMVEDLTDMVAERLNCWKHFNGNTLPKKIIIYRDGVSEGQFDQVLTKELTAVRAACQKLYTANKPKLTLIICNKRHNTRAFPTREDEADRYNGYNCLPGTVFDRGVTQPKYWEFFLQAHASLQGHARPARYVVLLDEIGFGANEIQTFTHNLCYLFNRATKAISVCPPAYYADLLCTRGRAYLHSIMNESDPSSASSTAPEWEGGVHDKLKNSTWYI